MTEKHMTTQNVSDTSPIFCNEFTITQHAENFLLDFHSLLPQFGPGGVALNQQLLHKVVHTSPFMLKVIAGVIDNVIKAHEKEFGKIEKSPIVKKMEAKAKKSTIKPKAGSTKSYIG